MSKLILNLLAMLFSRIHAPMFVANDCFVFQPCGELDEVLTQEIYNLCDKEIIQLKDTQVYFESF